MSSARVGSARACALALSLSLVGCGATGPMTARPARPAAFHDADGWRVAADPLSMHMRAIASELTRAGLSPWQEAFRGFLTAGSRGTHRLDVPARSCVTLLAIGSDGIADMDAALYNPDGDVLAIDAQPDPQPTLQVCSGAEPTRLYYMLQVYEGAGSFLVAGFLGQRSTLEAAAKLLGARSAVADLGDVGAEGPGRVGAFRDGLQRRGFRAVQSPLRVPLVPEQRIRSVLSVEPGACYTAAGFALDGLENIDLRVLDDEGVEVARDASQEEDASVQFCTDRGAEYAAEVQGVSGKGSALLLLFRVEASAIGGRAGLWLGERPLAKASTTRLDDAIAAVTRRAAQDGFERAGTPGTGQLAPGGAVAQRLSVRARRCARIHAVGGPGVRRLQLVALDASGQRLAEAEGDAETAYVHVCSAGARELNVQAHAVAGAGPFAIAMFEAPNSAVIPRGVSEVMGAELQQIVRRSRDAGYRLHPEFEVGPQRVELQADQAVSIALEREPMRCVRAYVLSRGASARGELVVAGKQVDAASVPGEPARFCTGKDSAAEVKSLELRLRSDEGQGEAWVVVLVR
jgi:hypothetical protein